MASLLVGEAYCSALRMLAAHHGVHYQGLSSASRQVPGLSPSLRRRLQRLDAAYQIVRHITQPYVEKMLQEIQDSLVPLDAPSPHDTPCSLPSSTCSARQQVEKYPSGEIPADRESRSGAGVSWQPEAHLVAEDVMLEEVFVEEIMNVKVASLPMEETCVVADSDVDAKIDLEIVQEAWKVVPPCPKRYCFRSGGRGFMIPCRACGRDSLFGLCGDCNS